jgi:hypothetical protein
METRRRLARGAVVVMLVLAGNGVAYAATPPVCAPPASQTSLSGSFSNSSLTILNSPVLQVQLVGASGTFQGHVILEPIAAPPPTVSDGCKEDSEFVVSGFTGSVVAAGPALGPVPLVLVAIQPINARLQVHFGPELSRPLLTFRSDTPVQGSLGTVRFVQIVGGQIISTR